MRKERVMKMGFLRYAIALICVVAMGTLCVAPSNAEVGVTDDKILLGTFQDMSGPAAYLGKMCTAALGIWKMYVNKQLGGINGRQVDFVVEDNKYDPVLTKTAFTKLVNQHKVFAITTVYGSSPCTAILEDIKKEKIPVLPTVASVQTMFDPPNRYLFWYAANGQDEGILFVDYVVNDLKVKKPKLGVIYQEDEWGKDGRKGVEMACKKYGLKAQYAPYKRGSKNLSTQVMKLKAKGVTHCFFVGYAPVYAGLLKEAKKVGWKPKFFGDYVSVDPRTFIAGDLADGHYHIFAWGLSSEKGPGREQLERLFKAAGAEQLLAVELMPSIWNPLMLLTEGLQKCGKDLTREKLIDTIESIGEFDTGGLGTIGFGPNNRKGTKYYRILQADAKNKTFKAVTDWREPSLVWGKR
jgi:branched-chain amino acid transport system substrate-binding protein